MRLDQLLVEKGLFPSRTRAQAAIMAGIIFVNGRKAEKAGHSYPDDALIEVKGADHPYVGRGGLKLEAALKGFTVDPAGRIALDIGASTGGFTDCLLQHGAGKVYAVDVGHGQLDYKLRMDPRVKVIERFNARNLTLRELGLLTSDISICVIDVSFISLTKILPAVHSVIQNGADVIALIKPQFEAQREQVGKGGIVKDEKVRNEVIEKVKAFAVSIGFKPQGLINSPIEGADGNVEFLLHLIK